MKFQIYIHHYRKMIERKIYLQKMLERIGKSEFIESVKWMDWFDRETIDPSLLALYNPQLINPRRSNKWFIHAPPQGASLAEQCCAISHMTAWKHYLSTNPDKDTHMISFEDDVVFVDPPTWADRLYLFTRTVPADWDILFIGEGIGVNNRLFYGIDDAFKIEHKIQPDINWYRVWAPKAGDSYILNSRSVKTFIDNSANGFCFPADHELNWHIRSKKLNAYMLEPPITKQGTFCGQYKSAFGANDR